MKEDFSICLRIIREIYEINGHQNDVLQWKLLEFCKENLCLVSRNPH